MVAKRRKIELVFPETASDADAKEAAHWRNGRFSDWTLQLGGCQYKVHRLVLGQGPRSSVFLQKAFTAEAFGSASTSKTVLTGMVPESCYGSIFEAALDFVYEGAIPEGLSKSAPDLVKLCKVGDSLQMRALLESCVSHLNRPDLLNAAAALSTLRVLGKIGGLGAGLQGQLEDIAVGVVAAGIREIGEEDISALPLSAAEKILGQPELVVPDEDVIFDMVRSVVRDVHEPEARIRLWQQVRFGQLSCKALLDAQRVEEVPRELYAFLVVARSFLPVHPLPGESYRLPESVLSMVSAEWAGVHHFIPRKRPDKLQCAYAYSLRDTDAEAKDILRDDLRCSYMQAMLEHHGLNVTIINMHRKFSLEGIDVIVIGEIPDEIGKNTRQVLKSFLGRGGGIVLLDSIFSEADGDDWAPIKREIKFTDEYLEGADAQLVLESPQHPIFHGFDPAGYMKLRKTTNPVEVASGAKVLAQSSNYRAEIIESAGQQVLCFLSSAYVFSRHTMSAQMDRLIANAVRYVAMKARTQVKTK